MFEIYKKGQGAAARWVTAAALGAFAVFGCFELEGMLSGRSWGEKVLNLGVANVSVSVLLSLFAFAVAAVLVGLLVNNRKFVDYLIACQLELRKVSWPTQAELKRQTVVVILTIVFFSAILLTADLIFTLGSSQLYGY